MASVVDLQLFPQVPHAISNCGSTPDLLAALKRKNSISFEQNSTKFYAFSCTFSSGSKDSNLLFIVGAKGIKILGWSSPNLITYDEPLSRYQDDLSSFDL